eukprot:1158344-Pelagomonas_calceolata.AAC.9
MTGFRVQHFQYLRVSMRSSLPASRQPQLRKTGHWRARGHRVGRRNMGATNARGQCCYGIGSNRQQQP